MTSICSSGERDEVVLVGTEKGEVLTIDLRMGGVVQSLMPVSSSSKGGVRWIAKRRRRGSGKGGSSRGRTRTTKANTSRVKRVEEDKKKPVMLNESISEPQKTQDENILKQNFMELSLIRRKYIHSLCLT